MHLHCFEGSLFIYRDVHTQTQRREISIEGIDGVWSLNVPTSHAPTPHTHHSHTTGFAQHMEARILQNFVCEISTEDGSGFWIMESWVD